MLIQKRYEGVTDYLAVVCDESLAVRSSLKQTSHDTGRKYFFWTETFDEAVELAKSGWAEGAAKVEKHREQCEAFLRAAKAAKAREFAWDVEGHFVDIGRFLTGEPECCGNEIENGDTVSSRVVCIRLNQAVSGSVEADQICARGVTVLCAVDLLESCGIRCEVRLAAAGSSGDSRGGGSTKGLTVESHILLKRPSDPVDIDRLAFWIAHPASFRRFGFRAHEQNGLSPCGTHPVPVQGYGEDPTIVEVDSICTATGLSQEDLRADILAIAKACGLTFDEAEIEAITQEAAQ